MNTHKGKRRLGHAQLLILNVYENLGKQEQPQLTYPALKSEFSL